MKAPLMKAGTLFDPGPGVGKAPIPLGETTLDRLHQTMLLFGDGRSEALRRVLAEPGYVQDPRFRRLAQAMSSLYPASSQEKRWVDGVLNVVRQAGA